MTGLLTTGALPFSDSTPRTEISFVRGVSSRGVRLNHITLPSIDVEASAAFYARLGLTQIVANYPAYARFLSPEGETTLSLHRAEQSVGSPRASIHFEVDDVDQTVERLKRDGFIFVCEPVDQSYLWREAIMLDPDGHHVFIYHAGENRLDPPWRLDSGSGTQSTPQNALEGLGALDLDEETRDLFLAGNAQRVFVGLTSSVATEAAYSSRL